MGIYNRFRSIFQFSLRELCLIILLASVTMGWWVNYAATRRREDAMIERLQILEGYIELLSETLRSEGYTIQIDGFPDH